MFTQPRPTHPFRIIENDAISIHSMTSLGRVGRILAGSVDVSNISIEKESSQSTASSNAPQSMNPSIGSNSPETNKSDENVNKEDNRDSPVPSAVDSTKIVFQGNTFNAMGNKHCVGHTFLLTIFFFRT